MATQVEHDGLRFDVDVSGPDDGVPVVLLHGFPQDAGSWTEVAARLADAGHRVLAPDQRGYSPGARPGEVADYTMEVLAQDVLGIAAALGHREFHLVGHDWGAAVAWHVAAHHANRVRSLTAVSVPHLAAYGWALREDPEQQQKSSYIKLLRIPGKAEDLLLEDDAGRLRAMYTEVVPAVRAESYVRRLQQPGALTAALNWYRAMSSQLEATPVVTLPTTYLWGEDDLALGRAGAERCGEFVTGDFRFVPLPGIGHWVPEQVPDVLADAILDRIRSCA